jgi:hypothetical protein
VKLVLLPATATAERVAAELVAWSGAALLRPFYLWSAQDAGTTQICRVRDGRRDRLALADALARDDAVLTDAIAVRPAASGETVEADFAEAVAELVAGVRARVNDFDRDAPVSCTMAVVPETTAPAVEPGAYRAGWINLCVAPEDRAQPGRSNGLEGDGQHLFVRHAAHAAATLAELWVAEGLERPSVVDRLHDEPAGPLPVPVRVVRCYSRSVELGHVADHLAAAVFSQPDGWPRPEHDRFERAHDPGTLVARLARAYLDKHAETLAMRPLATVKEDPARSLGLLEALREIVRRILILLGSAPRELAQDSIESVHDKAAQAVNRLLGPTADAPVPLWGALREEERGLPQLCERIGERLDVEDGFVAAAWVDLRQLALGLVDGSELPNGVGGAAVARGNRRYVVTEPRWIGRDPQLGYAVGVEVGVGDSGGDDDDDESDSDNDGDEMRPLLQCIRVAVARAAEAAARRAEDYEPPTAPVSARREQLKALLIGIATSTLVAAGGGALAWLELSAAWRPAAVLGAACAWLLGCGESGRRTLMRQRIADDEQAARDLHELNRTLGLAQARGDAERLARRLVELDTWIEILAELVHRPWVRDPFETLDVRPTIDDVGLPAAFTLGVARPDAAVLDRVAGRARARAFRAGWLDEIYRAVERDAMETWQELHGGDPALPDPAADLTSSQDSPRTALRDAIRNGEGRQLRANPLTRELLEALDACPLDVLAPHVQATGQGWSDRVRPLGPTATWIEPPEGVSAVAVRRLGAVLAIGSGRIAGVLLTPRRGLTSAAALRGAARVTVTTADGLAIAGVAARPLGTTGLAQLDFRQDVVEGLDEPAIGAAQRRQPLAAPSLDPAGAVVRWGFVVHAGTQLEVAYDDEPPPGTPLFDLDGALVAIHGTAGRAHPAAVVTMPAGAPEADGEAAAPVNANPTDAPARSASEFLRAIGRGDRARALQPAYWASRTDANEIEQSLPERLVIDGNATIGALSSGSAFMRPLRVMVHCIELSYPTEPEELACCTRLEASPA